MKITIDGIAYPARAGQTVLDVARESGIYIPSLCYHPRTGPAGKCRVCVAEIEGMRGLQTTCTVAVKDGMNIRTDSEKVRAAQRLVVDLLLSSGKHDCLACEQNGACELQNAAYFLGIERPSFALGEPAAEQDVSSEGIIRDHAKCIKCGRCIVSCNNNVMHEVIDFGFRGQETKVVCDDDKPMGESSCVQCGECVQVCPVGALVFKPSKGKARQWEVREQRVICPYCGVGCNIDVAVKDNKILWALGTEENWQNLPNQGMLCVKGRFGLDFVSHPDRLKTPLIRKDGRLVEASWDEALDYAASRLKEVKEKNGPGAIGCFASAKVTNEENYSMMRFARSVIGTNNVDHCARLCHASTVAGLAAVFGSGAMTNSMQEAAKSDVILITGSNTTWCHPVFGGMIKKAVKKNGVKLIVVDPRETDLAKEATIFAQQKSGSDVAWLMGLQHIIVREGWQKQDYINERCEGWDEYRKSLEFYTPQKAEELSGIPQQTLYEIAKLFATGGKGAIYFSMGITQSSHGVDNVKAVANLSMITGNLGIEGGGVNPLRGQSNVQGACDMGALPNVFTGYQPVLDEKVRAKFAKAWGLDPAKMDAQIGKTVTTMVEACGQEIKALYIMGENPMISDPNLNHVEQQLKKLDFLIVQDVFLTETARMADVVLPGEVFAEKTGTYTNTERRVQISRAAVTGPAGARQDYEIIAEIAKRLGCAGFPSTPEALFAEIKALTPSYAGMTYARLEKEGLRWPCPSEEHPGTPVLHKANFTRGKGLLTVIAYRPPTEEPDADYPLRLTTGRLLEHFHTGTMSRRSKVLDSLVPHGEVEMHPRDAGALGIAHGDVVEVKTRRGEVKTRALVTEAIHQGTIFMAFHFAEAAANRLTIDALDPVAKIPEFKCCAARVNKTAR